MPSCSDCPYFLPLALDHAGEEAGRCRRFPPSQPSGHLTLSGPLLSFPVTLSGHLCGEHPHFPLPASSHKPNTSPPAKAE